MASDLSGVTLTNAVLDSFAGTPDPRLREILTSLVRHLHSFARDVELTQREWEHAIEFLTATGKQCDDTRQEFILLSDILGVSMLVETLKDTTSPEVTASTVLGPFHMTDSPPRDLGDSIDLLGAGSPCVVTGRVLSADGTPLPEALVDVWQADEHGFYDVQQPALQPPGNGRGLFTADEAGRFCFRTVVPAHYPIPTDGPVGALLDRTGRHPYRPAHIHFIASAQGHEPVTTHIFVADSPYIDSDAVFAVKQSLVVEFTEETNEAEAERYGVGVPYRLARFDLVLPARKPGGRFTARAAESATGT